MRVTSEMRIPNFLRNTKIIETDKITHGYLYYLGRNILLDFASKNTHAASKTLPDNRRIWARDYKKISN